MRSTIATRAQSLSIDRVADIVVTAIIEDLETGDFVREIRVLGTDGEETPEVFTLRLVGPTREAIDIAVPAHQF